MPLKNAWPLIWTNLNSIYPRIQCVMFGWNWPSGSGEDFQTFSTSFQLLLLSPLSKTQGPSFERNWIPLTLGCSVPSLVEIGPVVLENKLSMYFHWCSVQSMVEIGPVVLENKSSMYFHYVVIINLWQRAWPFIGTNLNRLHLGMMYVKHSGTWLVDSEEVNMWKDMDDTWMYMVYEKWSWPISRFLKIISKLYKWGDDSWGTCLTRKSMYLSWPSRIYILWLWIPTNFKIIP